MTDATNEMAGAIAEVPPAQRARELAALMARQRDLAGQLDALSQRQEDLIGTGDTERLLGLLGERNTLLAELTSGSISIDQHRLALGSAGPDLHGQLGALIGAHLSPAEAEEAAAAELAVGRLVQGVLKRDREARVAIREHCDRIAAKLTGGRTKRTATVAYGATSTGQTGEHASLYQDRKA
ncbi:MAG: hypothetical protein AAF235_05490 [Planctomycetota bacterium]